MGARIEIGTGCLAGDQSRSLPSWERGLKSTSFFALWRVARVAPLVGARIEITSTYSIATTVNVAPLVGARIEISEQLIEDYERAVAPLVGARIEMPHNQISSYIHLRRSPRGSED